MRLCTIALLLAASCASAKRPTIDLITAHNIASGESITVKQIGKVAAALEATSYGVINSEPARQLIVGPSLNRLGSGHDDLYGVGTPLPPGVYWNPSDASCWLDDGAGMLGYTVAPGGVLVIGAAPPGLIASEVSRDDNIVITCGEGFYACCCQNNGGSSRTSSCVANGSSPPSTCSSGCTFGGPEATGCGFPNSMGGRGGDGRVFMIAVPD